MPLQRTGAQDQLAPLTRFATSTIFEMLMAVQAAAQPWYQKEWENLVILRLGENFIKELQKLYQPFTMGCNLTELAIDYGDYNDVEGFIDYVADLPDKELIFYMLGRLYPKAVLPDNISSKTVQEAIDSHPVEGFHSSCGPFTWADNLAQLKEALRKLWSRFWNGFFKDEVAKYRPFWEQSLKEKQDYLLLHGGLALLERITKSNHLPAPLPADQPYTVIRYIPIYQIPRASRMYFGYGNVTILYDCKRTEQKILEADQAKQDALAMARALGDENRLKLLRLISDREKQYNGKKLAEKLGLSPSVVSRHLAQLKDAALILEKSQDNRNISYQLQWEQINRLSELLLLYLKD